MTAESGLLPLVGTWERHTADALAIAVALDGRDAGNGRVVALVNQPILYYTSRKYAYACHRIAPFVLARPTGARVCVWGGDASCSDLVTLPWLNKIRLADTSWEEGMPSRAALLGLGPAGAHRVLLPVVSVAETFMETAAGIVLQLADFSRTACVVVESRYAALRNHPATVIQQLHFTNRGSRAETFTLETVAVRSLWYLKIGPRAAPPTLSRPAATKRYDGNLYAATVQHGPHTRCHISGPRRRSKCVAASLSLSLHLSPIWFSSARMHRMRDGSSVVLQVYTLPALNITVLAGKDATVTVATAVEVIAGMVTAPQGRACRNPIPPGGCLCLGGQAQTPLPSAKGSNSEPRRLNTISSKSMTASWRYAPLPTTVTWTAG